MEKTSRMGSLFHQWILLILNKMTPNKKSFLESAKKMKLKTIAFNKLINLLHLCALKTKLIQFRSTLVIPIILSLWALNFIIINWRRILQTFNHKIIITPITINNKKASKKTLFINRKVFCQELKNPILMSIIYQMINRQLVQKDLPWLNSIPS